MTNDDDEITTTMRTINLVRQESYDEGVRAERDRLLLELMAETYHEGKYVTSHGDDWRWDGCKPTCGACKFVRAIQKPLP